MAEIKFYLDENISPQIANRLLLDGIDVVTVRDLGGLGDTDNNHLERATQMGRVLCTQDRDYLAMHKKGIGHSGIAFAKQSEASIGGWIKGLYELHEAKNAKEMIGTVYQVPMKGKEQ